MPESIKRIWMGSDPVEFESAFGLEESVERPKAATRRWARLCCGGAGVTIPHTLQTMEEKWDKAW